MHCPTTVGGNPVGLVVAERSYGLKSHLISLNSNYLNYPADKIVQLSDRPNIADELRRWKAVIKSLLEYDIIHYNYGRSLCPIRDYPRSNKYPKWMIAIYSDVYCKYTELLDVKMASFMNKVIAVTYQGDDARQGDFCRENYDIHFAKEDGNYYTNETDEFTRKRISTFNRHADLIYAVNPDLLHVLPKRAKFMPYSSVNPREWKPVFSPNLEPDIPHIVHAPSNRTVKGTKYIINAFEKLKAEGVPFRYTLVEGMPHQEARKIYETANLLIDQLLAGYYGGLSVELMALGKPVICYLRDEDMHFLPEGMYADMPIINANPDTIYDVLKTYLTTRKHELPKIGKQSRSYVERWHDPLKIAESVVSDYKAAYQRKRAKG